MVKLKLDEKTQEWIKLDDNSPEGFYLDGFLKEKLDNLIWSINKGWDGVILIDGMERSGKSILGMTCAHYLSKGTFTNKNISSGMSDAKKKIAYCENPKIVLLDESSLTFNSKDAMKKENLELQKIMDVVGQRNLILIAILPSIFDLNKNIATRRSRFLLHVYTDDKLNRGSFAYYGERKKRYLYETGKKNYGSYNKPKPDFHGSFTDFKPPYYEEYLKVKKASLIEALNIEPNKPKPPSSVEITKLVLKFRENCPEIKLATLLKGFGISERTFYRNKKTLSLLPSGTDANILYNSDNENKIDVVKGEDN